MIVETALSNRDCATGDQLAQLVDVHSRVEPDCIVRMNASAAPDESRILRCDCRRCVSGAEDIPGAAS